MNEYKLIIDILSAVFNGENLSKAFNENVLMLENPKVDPCFLHKRVHVNDKGHGDVSMVDDNNNGNRMQKDGGWCGSRDKQKQLGLGANVNISRIKDISYGVLRYYYTISAILDKLVNKKPKDEMLKIILFVAIYEINYTKKPKHAITNDLVELSSMLIKNQQIKGFVNAVIRNYIRQKDELDLAVVNNLVAKYNFPKWWIDKLTKDYPKQYQQILQNSNTLPKMNLRVNPRQISLQDYTKILNQENINFVIIDNKISLNQTISPHKLPLFSDGAISIQDLHAQRLLDFIDLKNGDYVLDACAAPGGKMCQILENFDVEMLGLDIDQTRLERVQQNLDRLKLNAKLVCGNASSNTWWSGRLFDVIVADVPCSASGTVKRNPDIKLHRKREDIDNFVMTQREIIMNLWSVLKSGGIMIYITCSIFKPENEDNINYFKRNLQSIKIIKSLSLLPTEYADGFFYCVLQKVIG